MLENLGMLTPYPHAFAWGRRYRWLAALLVRFSIPQTLLNCPSATLPLTHFPSTHLVPRIGFCWETKNGKPKLGNQNSETQVGKPKLGNQSWETKVGKPKLGNQNLKSLSNMQKPKAQTQTEHRSRLQQITKNLRPLPLLLVIFS